MAQLPRVRRYVHYDERDVGESLAESVCEAAQEYFYGPPDTDDDRLVRTRSESLALLLQRLRSYQAARGTDS